jgi:hypothetical protein
LLLSDKPTEEAEPVIDMKPRLQRWVLAMTAVCAVWACGDRMATEPEIASARSSTLSSTGEEIVGLVKRTEALPANLTASHVIGPRGGSIQIGRAGLRVEFARGAVTTPTRITVTALSGRNVAYRFEPHGLQFQAPVMIQQSLRHTVAWKNPALLAELAGSYFEKLLVDRTDTYTKSLERRPGRVRDAGRMFEFSIEHFSGYILSCGKYGVEVEVDVEIAR